MTAVPSEVHRCSATGDSVPCRSDAVGHPEQRRPDQGHPVPGQHVPQRDRFDLHNLTDLPERWWPRIPHLPAVVASILAVVAGITATDQLNAAFAAMHVPGHSGGTFTGIAGPGSLWSATTADQTIKGWYAWQATQIGVAHNIRVLPAAWITAGIHLFFIAIPVALLVWFAGRATARRFPVPQDRTAADFSDLGALARFAAHVRWPLTIVAAALVRDVALGYVVSVGDASHPILLRVIGALAALFYVCIALPLFALAYAHLAGDFGLRDEPESTTPSVHAVRRVLRVVVALRTQILAAVILPVLLLTLGGGLGEQIDDLALRWSAQWRTLIAAILAAIALYYLIRITGAACWRWYRELPDPRDVTSAAGRWPGVWMILAGTLLLAGYGVSFTQPAPWSLLLWPGLCLLGIGLVTRIERTDREPSPPAPVDVDDTRAAMRVVDVLGTVPLASLAIIAINAGVQLLVFRGALLSAGTAYVGGAVLALAACGWIVSGPRPSRRSGCTTSATWPRWRSSRSRSGASSTRSASANNWARSRCCWRTAGCCCCCSWSWSGSSGIATRPDRSRCCGSGASR